MALDGFDWIENSNFLLIAAGTVIAVSLGELAVGSVFLGVGVAYSFIS
ncbi:MAG: hypothetical protein WC408_06310 [Candidatus Micrarchaeia archaeon]|jgi:hypothetical protein